jgi:hypothetical protein
VLHEQVDGAEIAPAEDLARFEEEPASENEEEAKNEE